MVLQTTDRGCLYVDVLNSDFRCKWPSKNNFSELDISQSLVWQCPSLSPYFLLVKGHPKQKNEGSLARIAYEVASAAGARGSQQKEVTACNVPVFDVCRYCLRENTHSRASLVVSLLLSHSRDAFPPQQQGRQAEALESLHF